MNCLKRFKEVVYFGKPDRPFLWPQWIFHETVKRWQKEGMPCDVHLNTFFGFDRIETAPVNFGFIPAPEVKVIEEDRETAVYLDDLGNKWKRWKNLEIGMSQWLEFCIKDEESWEKVKKRLNPESPLRYPQYYDDWKRCIKHRDYPLGIPAGSFYGWIRNWMGVENLSVMFYDNPALVKEIINYVAEFVIKVLEKIVSEVKFDFASIWEDLGMKQGPLLSPETFAQFCLPAYKKVCSFLRSHGIDVIMVDSDGNNDVIVPLWLEGGVNMLFPLEVAANTDAVEYRRKYGKKLILMGNIDKRALRKTKKEVEEEVMRKVPYLLKEGGYLPFVDHTVPPDVPLKNFEYYLELVKEIWAEISK